MAISRGTKASAGGGTAFVTATTILADEVNTDFDTVYTAVNSILDGTSAIEPTGIDGYSDSSTERQTETTPGTTGSESDASTLAGELERIRYKLHEIGLGISTVRNTTASGDDTYWIDTPQMGPNLIINGNFAIGLESSVPPGWTNVNTATLALTTAGKTEGDANMRALRITAAGSANEGVSQTLSGLKASTKYVVGCRAKATAGDTFSLVTTGASGATFGNLTLTTTSTSYVTLAGVIVTDSTPTDIVVKLLAVADTDVVDVTHVWVRECSTDRLPMSNVHTGYSQITTDTANHYTTGGWTDSGAGPVTIIVPSDGYTVEVRCLATVSSANSGDNFAFRLREAGGGTLKTFYGCIGTAQGTQSVEFSYVDRSPAPGGTLSYTLEGQPANNAMGRNHGESTTTFSETAVTSITVRAYLSSGGN